MVLAVVEKLLSIIDVRCSGKRGDGGAFLPRLTEILVGVVVVLWLMPLVVEESDGAYFVCGEDNNKLGRVGGGNAAVVVGN